MIKHRFDKNKYFNAYLYFLNQQVKYPTKSKLLKLLYYLDFDHFEKYEKPVTGDKYIRKTYGPVPVCGEEILKEMEQKKLISYRRVTYKEKGYEWTEKDYVAEESYDPNVFSPTEMEMLSKAAERWEEHTATQLQAASHGEAPNLAVNIGDEIPYHLTFYRNNFGEMNLEDEVLSDSRI